MKIPPIQIRKISINIILSIAYLLEVVESNERPAKTSETNALIQSQKIMEEFMRCMANNHANKVMEESEFNLDAPYEREPKCPGEFDQILCWDETAADQWAYIQCPEWFIGFENRNGKAKRYCQKNGTWTLKPNSSNVSYTDYKGCIENLDEKLLASNLPRLKLIAKIGSYLSLGSLILAIILLLSFKRLHCARNILHVSLFVSFLTFSIISLIKETFWILSVGFPKDVIIEDYNIDKVIMNPNVTHWECKLLMGLYRYSESSNHVMIFCEALYLNTLVSFSTFSESSNYKYFILTGWVGPLLWIIPFIIIMATLGNPNSKLAKSTLILLPLFSIYYIAFSVWQPFVRGKLPVVLELIRLYFEIICSSFQGFAISCIYCFFNEEVRNEIVISIERKLLQRYPNMRRFSQFNRREQPSNCSFKRNNQSQSVSYHNGKSYDVCDNDCRKSKKSVVINSHDIQDIVNIDQTEVTYVKSASQTYKSSFFNLFKKKKKKSQFQFELKPQDKANQQKLLVFNQQAPNEEKKYLEINNCIDNPDQSLNNLKKNFLKKKDSSTTTHSNNNARVSFAQDALNGTNSIHDADEADPDSDKLLQSLNAGKVDGLNSD